MTHYLLSVHAVEGAAPRSPEANQKAYEGVGASNADLQETGAWVFAGGLLPPSSATVVKEREGKILVTDGPFAEGKEHLGGVWVIEAADAEAAQAWATKATLACGEPVELRPFQEIPQG